MKLAIIYYPGINKQCIYVILLTFNHSNLKNHMILTLLTFENQEEEFNDNEFDDW